MNYAEEALRLHAEWQGKIEVVSRAEVKSKDDLSLAYTPGVAAPCLAIQEDPEKSYELTRRHNLCAVITDGSAVLGLGDLVSNVNIPNRGQIPNLPLGAVVETNALFGLDRISPVSAGNMPGNLLPLVARHVYNQENTLKAALTCDRTLGFSTFMNDPQLGAVSLEDGQKLFNEMLEAQKAYLPEEWFM